MSTNCVDIDCGFEKNNTTNTIADNIINTLNFLIKDKKGSKFQLKKFNNLENILKNKKINPSVYALKIIKKCIELD